MTAVAVLSLALSTSSTLTDVASAAPAPLANAKKALLRLSDMPKGWTASASSSDNSSFPGAAKLAGCIGIPLHVLTTNPPSVSSPTFNSANQLLSIGDSVSTYPSAAAAATDFAALANSKTPACFASDLNGPGKKALSASFGKGFTIGKIDATRAPNSEFAPETSNIAIAFPVTESGVKLEVLLVIVDYVKGDEEQTIDLTAVQAAFPISLARRLTVLADARI
jgi:hypothetical protein